MDDLKQAVRDGMAVAHDKYSEIKKVLDEFAEAVEAVTENAVSIRVEYGEFQKPRTEADSRIYAHNRRSGKQEELCHYYSKPYTYPIIVEYAGLRDKCIDLQEFRAALVAILRHPATGATLLKLIGEMPTEGALD